MYIDWDTPGQNIQGTLLSREISNDPYPNTVRISMRLEDGTIVFFFAPTDLKGKITSDNVGAYVDITYLGKQGKQQYANAHVPKKFRVMREVKISATFVAKQKKKSREEK